MEKGKKASKYLREAREITSNCCSKVIKAQGALDHFFLAMQEKSDTKTSDKEEKEIELEIDKMQNILETFVEKTQRFERSWLKYLQRRTEKGRRDHLGNDSGFISVDSSVLPQPGTEPSSIIAQATIDADEKKTSEGFDISLYGPAALSSITVTEATGEHKSDTSFSEIVPTAMGESATVVFQDVKYYSRRPLEHEDQNSVSNRDKEPRTDTNDNLGTDTCDKLDPDSIGLSHEDAAKKNEKLTDNDESDLCETPTDEQAQDQAAARTDAINNGQVPKGEAMRESTVFVSNLGDDKVFLQTQGDHQKLRHKSSKNKSNSL